MQMRRACATKLSNGCRESLARQQTKLVFAMNAGMFHPDMKPVGLLVIDGHEIAAINRTTGSGNFYLQPNGVFLIDSQGARVLATDEYRESTPALCDAVGAHAAASRPDSGHGCISRG